MGKDKLYCQTCANQVNCNFCTMGKEMNIKSRIYKKCEGYKKYVPKPKPIEVKKVEKPINYEELGLFGKFLQKGGHYSFRTGEFRGINED